MLATLVLMLMFNIRSDLGGGSDPPGGGFFSSSFHRHQARQSGPRWVTTWAEVKERCQRTCLTKARKNLAMLGLLALHLGTMFAILSHNGVPPFLSDAILVQVLGILMAVGGAVCVIMSVFVFRRQKRRLHPCLCLDTGSGKEEEPLTLESDVYVPSAQSHSFQSFHHNHHGLVQNSHAHCDIVKTTPPQRDVSVVLTAPLAPPEAPDRSRSVVDASQRDPGRSRQAYKNPAFEDRTRKHRSRSEPNVHEQKVRYKMRTYYRGRPPFILRGGQVDLEQLTMSSLV